MAKSKKPSPEKIVPICVAMVLCDRVIVGTDQTATIVRIVDTIGVSMTDKDAETEHAIEVRDVSLFISLKSGNETGGVSDIVMLAVDPKGRRTPVGLAEATMQGKPENGLNIVSALRFIWSGEGLYWIELQASGRIIAKTPFRANRTDAKIDKLSSPKMEKKDIVARKRAK